MSYTHISEAIGIRKASIHHHLHKKKDMVDTVLYRCGDSYGSRYQAFVEAGNSAPKNLHQLAGVVAERLNKDTLCLVGMISSDMTSLESRAGKSRFFTQNLFMDRQI